MFERLKAKWCETSTRIGVAVLFAIGLGALLVAFFAPEKWPSVRDSIEWMIGPTGLVAIWAILMKEKP